MAVIMIDELKKDVSIYVERKVGSASISPSGRDVALASYVPIVKVSTICLIHD